MCDKGRGDIGLSYAPEGFYNESPWSVLEIVGDIVLNRGGIRKTEVGPDKLEEYPKISEVITQLIPCPIS